MPGAVITSRTAYADADVLIGAMSSLRATVLAGPRPPADHSHTHLGAAGLEVASLTSTAPGESGDVAPSPPGSVEPTPPLKTSRTAPEKRSVARHPKATLAETDQLELFRG